MGSLGCLCVPISLTGHPTEVRRIVDSPGQYPMAQLFLIGVAQGDPGSQRLRCHKKMQAAENLWDGVIQVKPSAGALLVILSLFCNWERLVIRVVVPNNSLFRYTKYSRCLSLSRARAHSSRLENVVSYSSRPLQWLTSCENDCALPASCFIAMLTNDRGALSRKQGTVPDKRKRS